MAPAKKAPAKKAPAKKAPAKKVPAKKAPAKKAGRTPAASRNVEFPSLQLSSSSSDSEENDISLVTRQNTIANSDSSRRRSPKLQSSRRSASKTPDPDFQRDLVEETPIRNDSMEARLSPVLRRASAAQENEVDAVEPENVFSRSRDRSPAKPKAAVKSGRVPLRSPPPRRALRHRATPPPISSTPRSNSKSPRIAAIPATIPEESDSSSSSSSSSGSPPPVSSISRASPKPTAKKEKPPAQPRMNVPSRAELRRYLQAHPEQAGPSRALPKSSAKKSKAAAEPSRVSGPAKRTRARAANPVPSIPQVSPPKRPRRARASPKPGPSVAASPPLVDQPPVAKTSRGSPKPPAKKQKRAQPTRMATEPPHDVSSDSSRSSGSRSSGSESGEEQAPIDTKAAPKPKPTAKKQKVSQQAETSAAHTGSEYQLHLPVARVRRQMKQELPKKRMAKNSSIAVAAAVQTILTEVIAGAMDVAKSQGTSRINPRHISIAIKADEELDHIFKDVTVAGAGYVPLHPPNL